MNNDYSEKKVILILVTILILGLFLRLYNLDQESLWTDEAFSVSHAQEKTFEELEGNISVSEAAPFGYYLVLHYWIKLFGSSEFSVRSPSVLFGILSILMLFLVVRRFFSSKVALLSSFFLATSMLQVLYSQEARIYSMFTFLTLLTTFFFIKMYQSGRVINLYSKKYNLYYLFYFLSILAALYTNYLSVFLIIAFTLILLWNWPNTKELFVKWIWIHVIVVAFSYPLISTLLTQFSYLNPGLSSSLIKKGVPALFAQLGLWIFTVPFILLIVSFVLILVFKDKIKGVAQRLRLGNSLFVGLLLIWALFYAYLVTNTLTLFGIPLFHSPITNSYFLIRHPFFLAPLLYVYVAHKIINLKPKRFAGLALLIILMVNIFSLLVYYQTPTKAEWKETVLFIQENNPSPEPLILLDRGGFSNRFLLEYYSHGKFEIVPLTWSDRLKTGREMQRIDQSNLLGKIKGTKSFWLILARNGEDDYYLQLLETNFNLKLSHEFYQLRLYYYTNNE